MSKMTYAIAAALLLFLSLGPVHAQATRTWVSGVGDDANPCSRTAPCKTFAGAISKTAAAGEINVLDPGGFGGVTITKSISILSQFEAGVLVSGTNAIIINALTTDVIILEGLDFDGVGTGLNGVRILAAGAVHVRKSLIKGFLAANAAGISVANTAGDLKVYVSDTLITKNDRGVASAPAAPGTANIYLDRVSVLKNAGVGIRSQNVGSTIVLNNSTVSGNGPALLSASNGQILSFGNNAIFGNGSAETPTGTLTPK